MFGVLLETAGTGTHVHDSALYHHHGDLMGRRQGGGPLVSLTQPVSLLLLTLLLHSDYVEACVCGCVWGHLVHLPTVFYTRIDINTHKEQQSSSCGGSLVTQAHNYSWILPNFTFNTKKKTGCNAFDLGLSFNFEKRKQRGNIARVTQGALLQS